MHSTTTNNSDYLILNLKKEYSGALPYSDKVKYAVVSTKPETELATVEELKKYQPFVVISPEMYAVITESNKNDEREHKRAYRCHDAFAINDERAPEDSTSDPAAMAESDLTYNHIINEMMKLPGRQGQRMYQHFVLGYSIDEIALAEGVTAASVYESLSRAKKAMHKVFVESGVTEE